MTERKPPPSDQSLCVRAQELSLAILEGDSATDADQRWLGEHLSDCAPCRAYRQSLANLTASVSGLPSVPVPAGLDDRIMAKIEGRPVVARNTASLRFGWKKAVPMAAAVLLLAMAAPWVMDQMGRGYDSHQHNTLTMGDDPPVEVAQVIPPELVQSHPETLGSSETPGPVLTASREMRPATDRSGGPSDIGKTAYQAGGYGASYDDGQRDFGTYDDYVLVDGSELAVASSVSGGPMTGMVPDLNATLAWEQEGDLYYDPISTLVGF